ncbi:type II toxin-antitoxin system VapB family antitoxin [Microbacterium sp. MYb62]|uniref:type II toxin-antitoxin system VapB family antitoxin n=1 Tax=Microbacterium sp. MYb62 TaxID=1848690 RepID=UPI0015E3F8CB|nr:type II toxin-antitoxin system VapB family antitoxin [Microbacterium sp. MYb62]
MSLNIKNETTHELVRRLAALTGQSQTSAVEDAVRRRLAELESEKASLEERRRSRIDELIAEAHRLPLNGPTTEEILADMYDEMGLPR